jgi:hypothetical protein
MNNDELIKFLKENMKIELSSLNNSRYSRFTVKLLIRNEEICSDYISLDELEDR